jgi:hypothetical protein
MTTLHLLAAPIELAFLGLTARRMWRKEPILPGVIGAAVASELTMMMYALFGWRMRRDVPHDSRAFTIHERSAWGTVAACIAVVVAAESIGIHLFLLHISRRAAWIVTALDVWGILWIIGDYHALRLRPILVSGDGVHVRAGMRWNVIVPWDEIERVEAIEPQSSWKRKSVLKVALIDEPRVMLRLRRTHIAHGIAGWRKKIDAIAILPDDELAFSAALRERVTDRQSAAHP